RSGSRLIVQHLRRPRLRIVGTLVAASCLAVVGSLAAAGCRTHSAELPKASSGASAQTKPSARWVFHPRGPQPISGRTPVAAGELVVDRGGTRWLMPKSGAPVPSPFGAPEGLLAARQDGAGFAFIGESGTVYLAAEPLGPLTEVRPPPVDAHGVAVHQEVILGGGGDGRRQ